jgi:16S rRNA (cytosine1402-N4)-methyltransferase
MVAGAGRVIGLDRDEVALRLATRRLATHGDGVSLQHARFAELPSVLDDMGVGRVDGIVADLGVSSMQLDNADRGMSFKSEGPLDMRMDRSCGETALDLIERMSDSELHEVLSKLGEERRSRRIARCIKQELDAGRMTTTLDLRRAVIRAVGPQRVGGVDPATRTFQALRLAVNRELFELEAFVEAAAERLAPGGVLAIIAFHSLEDRIVKRALRGDPRWRQVSKKPQLPASIEVEMNPRARSAKLRVAQRVEAAS